MFTTLLPINIWRRLILSLVEELFIILMGLPLLSVTEPSDLLVANFKYYLGF